MLEPKKKLALPVELFMKYKLRSLYAGCWDDADRGPLPITVPLPSPADMAYVASIIKTASKPVLVCGSQSTVGGPVETQELRLALEKLMIPTFLGGMSRGLLGADSEIHIKQGRGDALAQADVVILCGAIADFRLQYGRILPSSAKIISINRDAIQGQMNTPMFWSPTLFSQSDPSLFMQGVASRVKSTPGAEPFRAWRGRLKDIERAKSAKNKAMGDAPAVGRIPSEPNNPLSSTKLPGPGETGPRLVNPIKLLYALDESLPDDVILVADGGDFVATAANILRPRAPLSWLDSGAFGTLGVGMGFALGAALVYPDRQVCLIYGDGTAGYSIADIDTFARLGINNLTCVVGCDGGWTQIAREQIHLFGAETACNLNYGAYHTVAEGYGGVGVCLKDPDQDVDQALREAQKLRESSGRPLLINVHIGSTNFREGSISV